MIVPFHDLRKTSPGKAREIVRKVLSQNQGNVSKTAPILGTSRPTVRRARDGALEDHFRRPLRSLNKTPVILLDTLSVRRKEAVFVTADK
jgi:hypothetical protein